MISRLSVPAAALTITMGILPVLHAQAAAPVGREAQRGGAAPEAHRFEPVRKLITDLIVRERVPSIVVAVAQNGRIVWEEGFGWADRQARRPATARTPYSIASITKPMTATAVMMLHERGLIDLDAPLDRYLGRLRLMGLGGDASAATVRRAMSHTAGLPTHYYFYHGGYPAASVEQTMVRYGVIAFPPGRRFQYSNLGYRALDMAIASVSGSSYADFLRRELFHPLGMRHSSIGLDSGAAELPAALYDLSGRPIPHYETDTPGSGEAWASAHDVLRFGMFHLGTPLPDQAPILTDGSIRAMQQVSTPPGLSLRWGLGWQVDKERGYRVVRHSGNQPGVYAQLVLYPDEGVVIVVIANQNRHPQIGEVTQAIAAALLPSSRPDATADVAPTHHVDSVPRLTGQWSGTVTTYAGDVPFLMTVAPEGEVRVKLGEQAVSLLNQASRSDGALSGWIHGFMPTADARRQRPHILLLTVIPEGDELVGQIVAETILDPGFFALSSFVRLRRDP